MNVSNRSYLLLNANNPDSRNKFTLTRSTTNYKYQRLPADMRKYLVMKKSPLDAFEGVSSRWLEYIEFSVYLQS